MITFKLPYSTDHMMHTIDVPGSKSYTNRALIIGALTEGTVEITRPLVSDDTDAMIQCLIKLGIEIETSADSFIVRGDISDVHETEVTLHTHMSGTSLRFLLALSCVIPAIVTITGTGRLLERPIKDIVDSLVTAGAEITYLGKHGFPPVRINSQSLTTNDMTISGSTSSQFISALLMIAPAIQGITLHITGEVISRPYIDMTLDIMSQFGVDHKNYDYKKILISDHMVYMPKTFEIEGDMSSAAYFFAYAALSEKVLTVRNVNPASKQADTLFIDLLKRYGTKFTFQQHEIKAEGHGVKSIQINMESFPDQAMTVAVLSAFASKVSHISGIKSLRVKETERVRAIQNELKKMGINTDATIDELTIIAGQPHAATISTYNDHRIAMSFALASSKLQQMEIADPGVVTKTFPNFWNIFYALNGRIFTKNSNIVLIGMRGSGKSTVGKLLHSHTEFDFIDSDKEIARAFGKDVNEIITSEGWDEFRKSESIVVRRIAKSNRTVIACGGGVVLNEQSMTELKRSGIIIWLRAPAAILDERLRQSASRVPLTVHKTQYDEIKHVQNERNDLYRTNADVIIDSADLSPSQSNEKVLEAMELLLP